MSVAPPRMDAHFGAICFLIPPGSKGVSDAFCTLEASSEWPVQDAVYPKDESKR